MLWNRDQSDNNLSETKKNDKIDFDFHQKPSLSIKLKEHHPPHNHSGNQVVKYTLQVWQKYCGQKPTFQGVVWDVSLSPLSPTINVVVQMMSDI